MELHHAGKSSSNLSAHEAVTLLEDDADFIMSTDIFN